MDDRVDTRGEWFREWDIYSFFINTIPRWYWVGMALSACWIVAYLLIYPSLPGISSHWKGLGVPGGCQPWTAICELRQEQAKLDAVRGNYVEHLRNLPLDEIAADRELSEFAIRAAKVDYGDNCGGCHGHSGDGTQAGPALNDGAWQHGGELSDILNSIRNPAVHPFGLAARMDQAAAKALTIRIYNFSDRGRAGDSAQSVP